MYCHPMPHALQRDSGHQDMSSGLVHRRSLFVDHAAEAHVGRRGGSASVTPADLSRTIKLWIERSRQRKALADVADLSGWLLRDIGVSDEDARREAAKWFWQP